MLIEAVERITAYRDDDAGYAHVYVCVLRHTVKSLTEDEKGKKPASGICMIFFFLIIFAIVSDELEYSREHISLHLT